MQPPRTALAAVLLALGLAGCGSSTTVTSVRTVVVAQPATSSTTTAQPTTASSASSTATAASASTSVTSAASGPACTASDLMLASEGTNGAAGTIVAYFSLQNTSQQPCHTYGYPGVLFLTKSGAPLPTDATRRTHDALGYTPVSEIVLAPGKLASFRIVASLVGSGAGCPTAYGLQAIAPDDTATMRTTINGGLFECKSVTVSPLALGNGIPPGT
ncbi:MAG: DUF4232 domain-containing protein [Solirubrobacteraceae bacterium]